MLLVDPYTCAYTPGLILTTHIYPTLPTKIIQPHHGTIPKCSLIPRNSNSGNPPKPSAWHYRYTQTQLNDDASDNIAPIVIALLHAKRLLHSTSSRLVDRRRYKYPICSKRNLPFFYTAFNRLYLVSTPSFLIWTAVWFAPWASVSYLFKIYPRLKRPTWEHILVPTALANCPELRDTLSVTVRYVFPISCLPWILCSIMCNFSRMFLLQRHEIEI